MKRPSKRFTPTIFTERLVPILLALIALGLLTTLVIVGLSIAGLMPGF